MAPDTATFDARPRVGYVLKRYPRFSEAYIVREILAHEASGIEVEIFSLHPTNDTHFHELISRVKAPVTFLSSDGVRYTDPWAPAIGIAPATADRTTDVGGVRLLASRLAAEVRRRGVTHLHAHSATAAAQVTRMAALRAQVPYTMTLHVKDIFHEAVSSEELRTLVGDASRVVTVSDANRRHLIETLRVDPRKVTRIYRGITLPETPAAPDAADSPHLVCVGRLATTAGIADLLHACALLRDRGIPYSCDVVGSGPDEQKLHALQAQLRLDAQVRFRPPLDPASLRDLIASAAVLVSPRLLLDDGDRDGLPGVVLEAMRLGTPVLATDVAGHAEVVWQAETGVLVPARDPARMADGLSRLLVSSRLRRRLADRAQRYIAREFDPQRNAAALRAIFLGEQAGPRMEAAR